MSQNAGRNLERQWRANLSKVLDRQEKAKASWKIACSLRLNAGSAHWHPANHRLSNRQNVAGLWLLYGAKP